MVTTGRTILMVQEMMTPLMRIASPLKTLQPSQMTGLMVKMVTMSSMRVREKTQSRGARVMTRLMAVQVVTLSPMMPIRVILQLHPLSQLHLGLVLCQILKQPP